MASLCKHHIELNEFGEGRCSVPMFSAGGPDGFCDKPAYGNQPPGRIYTRWDGHAYREDGRYPGYVPALACKGHGGPRVRAFKDGSAWCSVLPDFQNLQESPAGFGETKDEAIAALVKQTGATP